MSVRLVRGVFVSCGGKVSVSGNALTGVPGAAGNREQAVSSTEKVKNKRIVGECFKVLFISEFAFNDILFIDGDLIIIDIVQLSINDML